MKAPVWDGVQDSHKFIKWVVTCQVLEAMGEGISTLLGQMVVLNFKGRVQS